jgi:hypothetical protein
MQISGLNEGHAILGKEIDVMQRFGRVLVKRVDSTSSPRGVENS